MKSSPWRGRRVLITAGPTREPLDPVRFLTNASSGKMGAALARAALARGARVTVVAGPMAAELPRGARVAPVTTARDMLRACLKHLPGTDLVIGAAAVGDFRPAQAARHKIKKTGGDLTIRLVPNPDILKTLARRRKEGRPVLVGFALETRDLMAAARRKLAAKGLDLIVANGPGALDEDRTRALLITRDGTPVSYNGSKSALADKILSAAEAFL